MRRLTMFAAAVLANGALAVSTASMGEAAEPAVWDGDLFVTKVTKVCTDFTNTIFVGASYRVTYRPNIAPPPTGQAKEALLILSNSDSMAIDSIGATLRGRVTANSTVSNHDAFQFGPDKILLNLLITPPSIVATTRVVEISGTINSFFALGGCNVSVTSVLGRRPG